MDIFKLPRVGSGENIYEVLLVQLDSVIPTAVPWFVRAMNATRVLSIIATVSSVLVVFVSIGKRKKSVAEALAPFHLKTSPESSRSFIIPIPARISMWVGVLIGAGMLLGELFARWLFQNPLDRKRTAALSAIFAIWSVILSGCYMGLTGWVLVTIISPTRPNPFTKWIRGHPVLTNVIAIALPISSGAAILTCGTLVVVAYRQLANYIVLVRGLLVAGANGSNPQALSQILAELPGIEAAVDDYNRRFRATLFTILVVLGVLGIISLFLMYFHWFTGRQPSLLSVLSHQARTAREDAASKPDHPNGNDSALTARVRRLIARQALFYVQWGAAVVGVLSIDIFTLYMIIKCRVPIARPDLLLFYIGFVFVDVPLMQTLIATSSLLRISFFEDDSPRAPRPSNARPVRPVAVDFAAVADGQHTAASIDFIESDVALHSLGEEEKARKAVLIGARRISWGQPSEPERLPKS